MKKLIYLLAITLSFVNFSCASLFSNQSNGLCSCTCQACLNCTGKHHIPLTADQLAKQDSIKAEQEKPFDVIMIEPKKKDLDEERFGLDTGKESKELAAYD